MKSLNLFALTTSLTVGALVGAAGIGTLGGLATCAVVYYLLAE